MHTLLIIVGKKYICCVIDLKLAENFTSLKNSAKDKSILIY